MDTVHLKPVKLSEILPVLGVLDKAFKFEDAASIIEQDGMGPLSPSDRAGINNLAPISLKIVGLPDSRVLVFS